MDKFYTYVVIVAFVILVLALIGLGVILQNQDKGEVFPPIQSKCPNNWVSSVSGCYIDTTILENIGDLTPSNLSSADLKYMAPGTYTTNASKVSSLTPVTPTTGGPTYYEIRFVPEALACDKRKWANMHGILWDGISNYNQC